jgi:uncharacterized RDD family membrane protein YckC
MTFDDRVTIATPEGVPLDLVVAGLGSRFIATLLDVLIEGAAIIAIVIVFASTSNNGFALAVFSILLFLVIFGYDVCFEVANSGRTIGKMAAGLRVLKSDGRSVDFVTSAVRNILRLIDFLPAFYAVGVVTIVATREHQRLGDIAAGTIVVRDRRASIPAVAPMPMMSTLPDTSYLAWDVSSVSGEEVATVRRYLERRYSLTPPARAQLGWELAGRLRQKVSGAPENWHPEQFLEGVVAAKDARGA